MSWLNKHLGKLNEFFGKPAAALKTPAPTPTRNKPDGGTVVRNEGREGAAAAEAEAEPSGAGGAGLTTLQLAQAQAWAVKRCTLYAPGERLAGRYDVEQRLEGGMGYVYIARDHTQNLRFAIKQPKEAILANREYFARVLKEADAWTGLGMHPHIAYCYFVRSLEEVPHIFIEYVDGGSLKEAIEAGRCADYRVGLELAIQCCHGMERAHDRGMLHRDLKPENILVSRSGIAKVTDFGLVGDANGQERQAHWAGGTGTRLGTFMGTPEYMAPEQARDPRRRSTEAPDGVGTDSDVYSFGMCLWAMFCGRLPYTSWADNTGKPPEPREARPDLPESLRTLLPAVVALDRRQRPQDFGALRERLNAIHRELFREDAPSYRIELLDTSAAELTNQGYSYYELGKREEAVNCFRPAVEKDPTHPQAVYNLGLLQWRAGEIDDMEVLRRLENCGSNPQNSAEALAELTALVHAERMDPDAAQASLQDYPGRLEALLGGVTIQPIRCLRTLTGHASAVWAVAMSGDGRRALSGSLDSTLKLWDLETGECLRTLTGHTYAVWAVAMSGDGRRALSGSQDQTLKLWSLETGECLRTLTGHTHDVMAVAMSGDGRRALSGSGSLFASDGTLGLWDLDTGECLRTLTGHANGISTVAVSGEGRRALSGSEDKTLKLWDLDTGQCLRTLTGHTDAVTAVAVTGDGWRALSGSYDHTLKLWDLDTGRCLRTLTGHTAWVNAVTVTSDGRRALSGSNDDTLKLWDLETGKCRRTLTGHTGDVFAVAVAVTGDGRQALSGSEDATLKLWDLDTVTYGAALQVAPLQSFVEKHQAHSVLQQALAQTDACLARGDFGSAYTTLLTAWEGVDFRCEAAIQDRYGQLMRRGKLTDLKVAYQRKVLTGHTNTVSAVAVTADWRRALSGSWDNTLKLWDLDTGECLRTLTGHTDGVTDVTVTGNGRRAVSGSGDKTLKLWDLETGQCLRTILTGHTDAVTDVAVTGDGRRALSVSYDLTLKLWDLETGQCLRTLNGHTGRVSAVAVTGDGRRALSGSQDNTLKLWDLETGECLRTLTGHTVVLSAVAVTGDGRWALSGSWDKTLKLWALDTGQCLRTLTGHTDGVKAVVVTGDGQQALSGGADNKLILWQLIWELEFPKPADWDEGARPYLEVFLTLRCPYSEDGVRRVGKPAWGDADFPKLIEELQVRGYGWLRPEGVRRELEAMTATRTGRSAGAEALRDQPIATEDATPMGRGDDASDPSADRATVASEDVSETEPFEQEENTVSAQMITPENATVGHLKEILESAFFDVRQQEQWLTVLSSGRTINVFLVNDNSLIRLVCGFAVSFKGEKTLEYVNKVNDGLIVIRASYSKERSAVWFEWYLPLSGGISERTLVLAIKRFESCLNAALEQDTENVVS